jgi:vacuolar-type H+-ATPase subunit E/Vma4
MVKKFTTDELTKLKDIANKYLEIQDKLGSLEIQKAMIEKQRNNILSELKNLQSDEDKLGIQLQEKYGEGTIDIERGEFTPKS